MNVEAVECLEETNLCNVVMNNLVYIDMMQCSSWEPYEFIMQERKNKTAGRIGEARGWCENKSDNMI